MHDKPPSSRAHIRILSDCRGVGNTQQGAAEQPHEGEFGLTDLVISDSILDRPCSGVEGVLVVPTSWPTLHTLDM